MSVFKILACDIKEGIIKNKRFLIVPFLGVLECMYAHLNIILYKEYNGLKNSPSFLDLIAEVFHGCDPIAKNPDPNVKIVMPYLWFAVFAFAIFISFDYMHNDLTQFGIQILSRTGKRIKWWISKCCWCVLSGIYFYILFILSVLGFCALNGYEIRYTDNPEIINMLADRSFMYIYNGINKISIINFICILLSPLLVICTISIIQMTLCLFIKPMYSYLVITGIIIAGILSDSALAFSRLGMVTFSMDFFEDGYDKVRGMIICISLIMASVLAGTVYFKKYDILPDKE